MKLHELKSTTPRPSKKRLGRGPGSGLGKTSGRGQKGQKARSGGGTRPGFEGGQTPLFRRIPKFGFKNFTTVEYAIVNVGDLEKFKDGSTVDHKALVEANLIKKSAKNIKILGNGTLTKKLTVKAKKFSKSAVAAIEKVKGKTEVE